MKTFQEFLNESEESLEQLLQKERERCARVCEEAARGYENFLKHARASGNFTEADKIKVTMSTLESVAKDIRALKD